MCLHSRTPLPNRDVEQNGLDQDSLTIPAQRIGPHLDRRRVVLAGAPDNAHDVNLQQLRQDLLAEVVERFEPELGLVGVDLAHGAVAHDGPVDVVDDVGEEVAVRGRKGGEHGLDLGFGRVGCHGHRLNKKGCWIRY